MVLQVKVDNSVGVTYRIIYLLLKIIYSIIYLHLQTIDRIIYLHLLNYLQNYILTLAKPSTELSTYICKTIYKMIYLHLQTYLQDNLPTLVVGNEVWKGIWN